MTKLISLCERRTLRRLDELDQEFVEIMGLVEGAEMKGLWFLAGKGRSLIKRVLTIQDELLMTLDPHVAQDWCLNRCVAAMTRQGR